MDDKILLNILAELAGLEEELATAGHTLAHHSSRERDLRELQVEYEEDAGRARNGNADANSCLRAKELEIRTVEAALAGKKEKITGVGDGRQYLALQREIAGLAQKLGKCEDEAMALLAIVEATEEGRHEAEAGRATQVTRGEAEISRMAEETIKATAAHAAIEADIARLLSMLPVAVRRHVQRLAKNGGRAVVHVESGACGGCFGQLPVQQAIDADKGRALVRCAGCARYVVHRAWH